jgi:glycosyltransferase involved in cell wall biosynthesis
LDAWAELGNSQGVRLVFAGYSLGDEQESLQRRLAANNIPNVEFVGFKCGSELARLYQNALCIALPALWYENIPNTVLEAMAYGKPTVGSDLGGVAEIVDNEENGLLCPPGDKDILSRQLRRLIEDRSFAEYLGRNARRKAETAFSPARHCDRLFSLMAQVVHEKGMRG